jgi:hypothetical protein
VRTRTLARHGALCVLVLVSCTRTLPPPVAPASPDPCVLSGSGDRPDTVRAALDEPIAPDHAPAGSNDGERLVFRQLYETLVRVDCTGAVRAGLASRWQPAEGGTRWTFELRPDARFWDGTPVDASALAASWRGDTTLPLQDVRAPDARTVVVTLGAPRAVESFADPAWGVVKRIPESRWPIGTGAVWLGDWTRAGADSMLRALPTPSAPAGTPVIESRTVVGVDPRDLLDGGASLLLTRDPAVQRYAAERADWQVVPLPWDRVYVLLSPARVSARITAQLDQADRLALARDAVRSEAQGPEASAWWAERSCQPLFPARVLAATAGARVAFPRGDAVARDLAERLVARADDELTVLLGEVPASVRTAGLDGAALSAALAGGGELAFVLPLPRAPADGCRAMAGLLARAPWLSTGDGSLADAVVPLVETRSYLLLRGPADVRVDRDGGVHLTPPRDPADR